MCRVPNAALLYETCFERTSLQGTQELLELLEPQNRNNCKRLFWAFTAANALKNDLINSLIHADRSFKVRGNE